MLRHLHVYLSSGLVALLLLCFANTSYGYGMECEKPSIVTATGVASAFTFDCKNTTSGAHFASYEIFPVCTKDSSPAGICDDVVFTATGCADTIAPGETCEVKGSFTPSDVGIYILDFNDRYGSVTYSNIFCNDPAKGCITADATLFAYLTPTPGTDIINQCPLNSATGELLSCDDAYTNDEQSYTKITFAVVNGTQYAYVTDQHSNDHGLVYQCFINEKGGFDSCVKTTPTLPDDTNWAPYAIAFATVNAVQYAYITDVNLSYIYQCSLDLTGNFTGCVVAMPHNSPTINAPYAIDFAIVNGTQYAYIGDAGMGGGSTGQVFRCTIKNDGSLDICTQAISPPGEDEVWIPYGIDFATIDNIQYAYVADNGASTNNGKMYQCDLKDSGLFEKCTAQNPPTGGWNPAAIALTAINGTSYAYVGTYQAANGNLHWCTINADGESDNGSFDECLATPDSHPDAWTPTSIAFRNN